MSGLEEYQWMLNYLKTLDSTNAKIIEGLGKHDPRNLLSLAEKIELPPTTVAFRVKRLLKEGFLTVRAKLNAPKLGLAKAVLIADANRGFADTLVRAIENVGYWTYTASCYGKFNGYYAIFSFPFKRKAELEDYFVKAKESGAMSNYMLRWTTNILDVAPNFDCFDFKLKAWNFPWRRWVTDILKGSRTMPSHLLDPESYEIEMDTKDLLILKELEKNGFEDFTQLAKIVKITPQGVRHRFIKHMLQKDLIAGYEVAILPYPLQVSDLCAFILDFPNGDALAKFANSLLQKPFVISYAKITGQNSLLVHFYVPKSEFSGFLASLNRLTMEGIVQDFVYVFLDVPSFKRQTVSYEKFVNGEWVYDHENAMRKMAKLVPLKLAQRLQ